MASVYEGNAEVNNSHTDPEQRVKFAEILEMLLAAGYFRARISGLTPFDKVIGGMAWAITASNVDVEVDIFFQEEAPLGTKIKLGETIIRALVRMGCPTRLQPQQIQGLDFINLFKVIQWLVMKVIETREETGDLLRLFSESQFKKSMSLTQDTQFEEKKPETTQFMGGVLQRYKPTRRFRKGNDIEARDESEQVLYTLLEYGNNYKVSTHTDVKRKQPSNRTAAQLTKAEDDEAKRVQAIEAENARREAMAKQLGRAGEGSRVAGSLVGNLVGMSKDEIQQAVATYGEGLSNQVVLSSAEKKALEENQYLGSVKHKQKQIAAQKEKLAELQALHQEVAEKLHKVQVSHNKISKLNARIEHEIAKLKALETAENAPLVAMLRQLVADNESLKLQEESFKESCLRQKAELERKIAQVAANEPTEEELEHKRNIAETFQADTAKVQDLRLLLAKKARDMALIERKIDEIPSRSELQQYQREFVELYEQVAAKLTETRQHYNSYNVLDDSRTFLGKEVAILASIQENYKAALLTANNRTKFIESLENIIKGIQQSMERTGAKVADEKKVKDTLNEKYLALLDKERAYYKAAKEFQEECKKNELLLERVGA